MRVSRSSLSDFESVALFHLVRLDGLFDLSSLCDRSSRLSLVTETTTSSFGFCGSRYLLKSTSEGMMIGIGRRLVTGTGKACLSFSDCTGLAELVAATRSCRVVGQGSRSSGNMKLFIGPAISAIRWNATIESENAMRSNRQTMYLARGNRATWTARQPPP